MLTHQAQKKTIAPYGILFSWPGCFSEFGEAGIRIYIENTNKGIARPSEVTLFRQFVRSFYANRDLRLGGCLDVRRFFFRNASDAENARAVAIIAETAKTMWKNSVPLIYRAAGYSDPMQTKESKVFPGSPDNLIPYDKIFKAVAAVHDMDKSEIIIDASSADALAKGVRYLRFLV